MADKKNDDQKKTYEKPAMESEETFEKQVLQTPSCPPGPFGGPCPPDNLN